MSEVLTAPRSFPVFHKANSVASQKQNTLSKMAARLTREETGATAVEYGIMIAAIAAVIITVVFSIGFKLNDAYTFVDGEMDSLNQP